MCLVVAAVLDAVMKTVAVGVRVTVGLLPLIDEAVLYYCVDEDSSMDTKLFSSIRNRRRKP